MLARRGEDAPTIRELRPADAARYLLRTMGLPFWDEEAMDSAAALISAAAESVPSFELSYAPNELAVATLLRAIDHAIPVFV